MKLNQDKSKTRQIHSKSCAFSQTSDMFLKLLCITLVRASATCDTCSRTLRVLSRRRHLFNDLSDHIKHAVWRMSRLLRLIRIIQFNAREMFRQIPALPSFLMQLLQCLFPRHMLKRLGARSTCSISSPHMCFSRLDLKLYREAVSLLVQAKWHSWRRQSLKDCRCEVLSRRHVPHDASSLPQLQQVLLEVLLQRTCSRPSCSIRLMFLMFLHVRHVPHVPQRLREAVPRAQAQKQMVLEVPLVLTPVLDDR